MNARWHRQLQRQQTRHQKKNVKNKHLQSSNRRGLWGCLRSPSILRIFGRRETMDMGLTKQSTSTDMDWSSNKARVRDGCRCHQRLVHINRRKIAPRVTPNAADAQKTIFRQARHASVGQLT